MEVSWSTVLSIIYFSVYTFMMFALAYWIWKHEDHTLDRTFLKSIWIQRKIYGQVLVHFYDTATDIGVLISWFALYMDERSGDKDYESVDMEVFFWSGIAVLAFYRLVTIVLVIYTALDESWNEIECALSTCMGIPLAVLDLFVFRAIYDSFKSAEQILKENQERLKRRRDRIEKKKERKRKQKLKDLQKAQQAGDETSDTTNIELTEEEEKEIALKDIDPAQLQYFIMLAEAVFESMPQVSFLYPSSICTKCEDICIVKGCITNGVFIAIRKRYGFGK